MSQQKNYGVAIGVMISFATVLVIAGVHFDILYSFTSVQLTEYITSLICLVVLFLLLGRAMFRFHSKQKQSELALVSERKSNENIFVLFDNSTDSMWSVDLNLIITMYNSVCKHECMVFYGTEMKTGMHIDECIPPSLFARENEFWKKYYRRALSGESFSEELTSSDQGRVRNYLITNIPLRQEETIVGVTVISKDVTELKSVKMELASSSSLLSATFDSSNEGILAVDPQGKILNWNKRFASMWKIPKDILQQGNDMEALRYVLKMLKQPEKFLEKVEYLYGHPDEESYDIIEFMTGDFYERYSHPINTAQGNIGRLWTFRNITGRVRSEQEIKKASDEISDLYHNAPCGYHSVDPSGLFLNMNETELRWLGYSAEEVIGKLKITDLVPLEEHDTLRTVKTVRTENASRNVLEYNFIRKDGSRFPLLAETIIVFNQDGSMVRSRTTVFNMEDKKRSESELVKAKEKLEKSLKQRELFIANISHEIRTPLNGISGVINLLHDYPMHKEQLELIDAMKISAENMIVIVNDILDMSKLDAGKIQVYESEFELYRIIKSMFGLLQPKALEKKIQLSFHIDPKVNLKVLGDPVRLNQILLNILNNSIKFTERGNISLKVECKDSDEEKQQIQFIIQDSGIGIAEDKLQTIFDSYSQLGTDVYSNHNGTGLGLSIVRKLVEILQGTIEVSSTLNVGSKFTITIPLKKAIGKQAVLNEKESWHNVQFKDARVLVADDDSINLLLFTRLLMKWGIHPDAASNGKECIEKASEKDYDMIFMDVMMPEKNGYEATGYIREHFPDDKKNVVIVALTAMASVDERDKCLKSGMNDYLSKPFTTEELYNKLNLYLASGKIKHEKGRIAKGTEHLINRLKVTDLKYLRELSDGSDDFLVDMILHFQRQTPATLTELETLCNDQNWAEFKALAHRMKPSLAFVGLHVLEQPMEDLEVFADQKLNLDKIPGLLKEVQTICEKSYVELDVELNALRKIKSV